jgi:hypothetical protein
VCSSDLGREGYRFTGVQTYDATSGHTDVHNYMVQYNHLVDNLRCLWYDVGEG